MTIENPFLGIFLIELLITLLYCYPVWIKRRALWKNFLAIGILVIGDFIIVVGLSYIVYGYIPW